MNPLPNPTINMYNQHKADALLQKKNKADRAVVPIENSLAGRVADTLRLIPESGLKIIGEYFLPEAMGLLNGYEKRDH